MKWFFSWLAVALFAFGCGAKSAEPTRATHTPASSEAARSTSLPPSVEDISALLEPVRQKHHLPALGGAIVGPDGVTAVGVTGIRKWGDPTPADAGDTFHLGSNTKAITGVVIAKLVEQGKIKWSTTIKDVFSDVREQNPAYANVTIEQLLSHRGGFPHDPKTVSNDTLRRLEGSMRDRRAMYANIALKETPVKSPGTEFSYSNVGYVLAGTMAERLVGRAWEDLVREIVFIPLKMTSAGFGVTASPGKVDGLWAHRTEPGGDPIPLEPGPFSDNPFFRTPAGSIHVSLTDWGRFIGEELKGFEGKSTILTLSSLEHLHTAPFGGTYAFGWEVVDRSWAGGPAYTHSGSNTFNMAVAWMAPAKHLAFLAATNVAHKDAFTACDDVIGELIKHRAKK